MIASYLAKNVSFLAFWRAMRRQRQRLRAAHPVDSGFSATLHRFWHSYIVARRLAGVFPFLFIPAFCGNGRGADRVFRDDRAWFRHLVYVVTKATPSRSSDELLDEPWVGVLSHLFNVDRSRAP